MKPNYFSQFHLKNIAPLRLNKFLTGTLSPLHVTKTCMCPFMYNLTVSKKILPLNCKTLYIKQNRAQKLSLTPDTSTQSLHDLPLYLVQLSRKINKINNKPACTTSHPPQESFRRKKCVNLRQFAISPCLQSYACSL